MVDVQVLDEDDRVVCQSCEVAGSARERLAGLIGRRSLARGRGMLLPRTGAVHTAFVRFPLDVVFLDREQHVIRVAAWVDPFRVAFQRGARQVLELPGGEAARAGVAPGTYLRFVPRYPSSSPSR